MAYGGKLGLAGSFKSSQSSSFTFEKNLSTISPLMDSNLDGSHCKFNTKIKDYTCFFLLD